MFIRLRQTDGQADETTAKREFPMNRIYRLIVNHASGQIGGPPETAPVATPGKPKP